MKGSKRKKIVDSFYIDYARCMRCDICVEVCNFDAIVMNNTWKGVELSCYDRQDLVLDKESLLKQSRTGDLLDPFREPMGVAWRRWRPVAQGHGGTLHLWGASERRLRAKHALYRVTERIRWPEKPAAEIERYYNLATTPREPWTFKGVPPEWLETYQDLMPYLHIDAEPWQVSEVKRLVLEHGVQKFHGLDLLGVPEW